MTRTAINNLHERWGLSSADIAHALGTTQRVARLARDGSEAATGADRLDTFLSSLYAADIAEPAAWMGAPVVDGYTVTRWHLYAAGYSVSLLRNATGNLDDVTMLDSFDPDWRRTYWTSFKTVDAEDGGRSVVGKSYDDVRAQIGEVA